MTKPFLRPVQREDIETLDQFASQAGFGFTSLPKKREFLEKKLETTCLAFEGKESPNPHYLFGLDNGMGELCGVSGIAPKIGLSEPFYCYHNRPITLQSKTLKIEKTVDLLHFVKATHHPTELSSLFLFPSHRKKEWGRLLSFSRFLFIKNHRRRFSNLVIAQFRGYVDERGISPFWDAVGRPFFQMEYEEASSYRLSNPKVIEELFPKEPLFPLHLPEDAQNSIGMTHQETTPALKILQKEGFSPNGYFDLLDGGPHLSAHTDEILAIKESQILRLSEINKEPLEEQAILLGNLSLDFRACLSPLKRLNNEEAALDAETAKVLELELGDNFIFLPHQKEHP